MKYFSLFLLSLLLLIGFACSDDMPTISEEEILSGGANFTTFDFSENTFGNQGNALSRDESRLFVAGNSLFRSNWVQAPASVTSLDGLGPVFNAISCGSCHFKDGRAAPMDEFNVPRPGILWRISVAGSGPNGAPNPHPVYGDQIQDRALPKVDAEGVVQTTYESITGQYEDGTSYSLQKPIYELDELAFGPIEGPFHLSPRIATHLAGLGLLEAIPEADLLANADPADADGDGISGKANYVWDVKQNREVLGRFGWKANQPSIEQQNAGAFSGDMGLTTSLFPEENFTSAQKQRFPDLINGGAPEVSDDQLFRITLYVQALAVPAKRNTDEPAYFEGQRLFQRIGCESCHVAEFTTGSGNTLASLDLQQISPYTDLLLRDMGEGLSDDREDFKASGREWRTPPLWGIGMIETVNDHSRLLHDGRARDIEEAILWHGGEAEAAQQAFKALSEKERADLIFFLKSI